MLRPTQCRAARGLLEMSQLELAKASGVPVVTLRRFEGGKTDPRASTLERLEKALEAAGVKLLSNGGVEMGEARNG